jgi:hypothetical protein
MQFEKPFIAVKQVPAGNNGGVATKLYTKTLVLFQLTGVTNISGVNNIPSANLYVTVKLQGKMPNLRSWGIENNKARVTYLGHYYGVDNVPYDQKCQDLVHNVEVLACTISPCSVDCCYCGVQFVH